MGGKDEQRLGKYHLLERIHVGESHEIFVAATDADDRTYALKRLLPAAASDVQRAREFTEAARINSLLDHPAICRVVDSGVEQSPYLVREYIDGKNLRDLARRHVLRRRLIDQPLVLHIISRLCAALHYAHRFEANGTAGILHIDVDPQNILIGFDGEVRLINFRPNVVERASRCQSLEREAGNALGRHTDILGVGLTACELLMGRAAYPNGIESDNPILTECQSRVPERLGEIISRAMNPTMARRFAGIEQLQQALAEFSSSTGHPVVDAQQLGALMTRTFPQAVRLGKERAIRANSSRILVDNARPLPDADVNTRADSADQPTSSGSQSSPVGRQRRPVLGILLGILIGAVVLIPVALTLFPAAKLVGKQAPAKPRGVLRVVSEVPNAGVWVTIDDQDTRLAVPVRRELSPGRHRLTVYFRQTKRTLQTNVVVPPATTATVRLVRR